LDQNWLERKLLDVASAVVPIEIGSPPIPMDQLSPLEDLRQVLRRAGAKGTRASIFYAFGLHFNPELPSLDVQTLLAYLRAFLLLYPWLRQRVELDLSRAISPYVNRFPSEYARLVLDPDYQPDAARFIDDYLEHNPTRNRGLDLLPALACLDEDRALRSVEDPHLVKSRPALHYRLPNCDIDDPRWTLASEWNTWIAVERLAIEPARMLAMCRDYLDADDASLRPFVDLWPDVLERYTQSEVL
jgi:hypothetical protein